MGTGTNGAAHHLLRDGLRQEEGGPPVVAGVAEARPFHVPQRQEPPVVRQGQLLDAILECYLLLEASEANLRGGEGTVD